MEYFYIDVSYIYMGGVSVSTNITRRTIWIPVRDNLYPCAISTVTVITFIFNFALGLAPTTSNESL